MIPLQTILNLIMIVISAVFWLTVFVIFYHLARFGTGTMPKKISALFLIGAVVIFSTSVIIYTRTDFTTLLI